MRVTIVYIYDEQLSKVYTTLVCLLECLRYLPGSGAHRSAWSEMSAVRIVNAGVHSFLRISRQIAPVCELILGCQILVSNFIYCTHADTNTQNLVNHFETNSHSLIVKRQEWLE